MRFRRRISARHRTHEQRIHSSEAAHHRNRSARRRSTMVRAALRTRTEFDESRPGAGENLVSGDLFDLSGRVAIVTGTSRGLGQTFARALAGAGADLVLTSRKRESLSTFEAEIKALGRRAISLDLDVRNQESIERMVAAAEDAFGHLDILVNNAGCNVRKPALDVTWDDWNLILDTNLRGSFFVAQAVARRMIARAVWTHHQYRFGHECCRLRRPRSLWSKPRRHSAAHHEPGG